MTREQYESFSAAQLKELAKARGLKATSGLRKGEVVNLMLEQDAKEEKEKQEAVPSEEVRTETEDQQAERQEHREHSERPVRRRYERSSRTEKRPARQSRAEQRGERQESSERDAQSAYTGKTERSAQPVHTDRTERGAQPAYTDKTERSAQPEYTDRTEHTAQPAYTDRTERNAQTGRTDRTERTVQSAHTERTERGAQSTRTDRTERNAQSAHTDRTDRQDRTGHTEGTEYPQNRREDEKPAMDMAQLDSGIRVSGILEVLPDGYGFIRSDNYLPGENDVYVSPSQIRKFSLKTGDIIAGNTRIRTMQEKFSALLYLTSINEMPPAEAMKRYNFEDMIPIFPNQRLRLERGSRELSMRIVDLISPIGKGQRGMIVSQPKAGKTTLLKGIAKSILENNPEMHLIILLIDERPEEVTDIREAIVGPNVEVIYSTFDELPEHHKRVSEMVIERAKRLVEHRQDVVILLDSITRLARAYNLVVPPSGRTLSGGLDPTALHMPKRFFGAARNMREGGSLTILATALVDTGSKMDDVVYEEFKGTGNMELVLDRKLSEKRVFPAIDIQKSSTRREDLLLDREEQEAVFIMRRALNGMKSDDAVENILNLFTRTRNNSEFVQLVRKQKFI